MPQTRPLLPFWVACLFVFTIFSRELGYTSIAGIDYDLIGYNFFILYFLTQLRHFFLNQKIIVLLFILLIGSLASKIFLDMDFLPFWKQFIPITIIYLASYDVMCRYNYKSLFEIYVKIGYYTAVFGIIQFFAKLFFGLQIMTDYSQLFLDSIALEPSHYAIIIMPACIYTLYYFRVYKTQAIVLAAALLLTTSSTAYLVLLVLLLIMYRRVQLLLIMAPLLYFVFNNVLLNYDKFYIRYMGFATYFETNNFNQVYAATSISFLSNLEVAWAAIKANPIFGCGLGGHEEMYLRYFENSSFRFSYLYKLNAASAHSLIIRILSETGLIGFFFYLWALWKSLLLKADDYHRIISIACLSHFLGKALKLGGYFDYGTPFFAMILLFNFLDYYANRRSNEKTVVA
jgi:O-antigen ligase